MIYGAEVYGRSWLVKKVFKSMNVDFAFKVLRKLAIFRCGGFWIQSCQWQVATWNQQKGGRMHENKETSSGQTTAVQERTRRCQRKQHTEWQCIVFGESVVQSLIENEFSRWNKIKASVSVILCQFCSVPILLKMWVHTLFLQDKWKEIYLWHCKFFYKSAYLLLHLHG